MTIGQTLLSVTEAFVLVMDYLMITLVHINFFARMIRNSIGNNELCLDFYWRNEIK